MKLPLYVVIPTVLVGGLIGLAIAFGINYLLIWLAVWLLNLTGLIAFTMTITQHLAFAGLVCVAMIVLKSIFGRSSASKQ